MASKLSEWLHKISTGWMTLVALVVFLLFMAFVLPGQAAQAEAATGSAVSPDTSLVYSPDELYRMAEAYGPGGRQAYIRARFTFDLVFPLVYLFFLVTSISWLTRRAFAPGSPWQLANLVPVAGTLFDFLENASTSLVMARYPVRIPAVATLAPFFTLMKWLFVGGSFVVLGAAVVMWGLTRFRNR